MEAGFDGEVSCSPPQQQQDLGPHHQFCWIDSEAAESKWRQRFHFGLERSHCSLQSKGEGETCDETIINPPKHNSESGMQTLAPVLTVMALDC